MENFGYWGGRSQNKKYFSKIVFAIANELEAEDDVFPTSSPQKLSMKVVSTLAPYL